MRDYRINDHRHRFSVWAAARATQRGFTKVGTLQKALETCGVIKFLDRANFDRIDARCFDKSHRKWCRAVMKSLKKDKILNVTFGRAAKLIAIYLKSMVVLGPDSGTALARIAHPPIDSILLGNLAASDVNSEHKRKWAKTKWTKLDEPEYYELIRQLRQVIRAEPFWKLEYFWTITDDAES